MRELDLTCGRAAFPPPPPAPSPATAHVPDKHTGVEVIPSELAREPALTPCSELANRARKLQTRFGQPVDRAAAIGLARNHSGIEQLAKTRGEHRSGDPRDSAADLSKPSTAAEELTHDEQRPTLAQQIQRPSDRAKLTIALHAAKDNTSLGGGRYGFRTALEDSEISAGAR